MKIAVIIVRMLMGLMFLLSSVVVLFKLVPQQPAMPAGAQTFMAGIMASVYLLPLLKVTELICSIALITGRFVALAAVILFPIIINILLFHAYLEPSGVPIAAALLIGDLFLAYAYWDRYKPMLSAK